MKNKKQKNTKNESNESFPKTTITWLKSIFGKSTTNPYKSRDL